MNKKRSLIVNGLALVLLSIAGAGNPVQAMEPYWYVAAGGGASETSNSNYDDTSSFSIHLGNRVTPSTAIEFGYVDIDDFEFEGFSDSCVKIYGIDISALGLLPIGESV